MNFTREPLVETVITPKDGHKLVIRNSKGGGQEEFFVDAVEVISFGNSCFFRSLEKPKCFMVPVSDYEILEVRETRMLLKTPASERGIKIAGGREAVLKSPPKEVKVEEEAVEAEEEVSAPSTERSEKRRERKRYRKKRGKAELEEEVEATDVSIAVEEERRVEKPSLIPPPSTLISESLARYKTIVPPPEEEPEEESKQLASFDDDDSEEEIPF